MLATSSTIACHVRFLLENLNDSDVDSSVQELCEFVDYEVETSVPVLVTCIGCLTCKKTQANRLQLEKVVSSVFKIAMKKPNFGTSLSQALKDVTVTADFVDDLANALRLSTSEKISFGLALSDLQRSDARTSGWSFCVSEIEKLCVQMESTEQIQNIILFLRQSEDHSKHLNSFFQILSSSPILSDELHGADVFRSTDFLNDTAENDLDAILVEMEKEISVGDFIEELGYGFTADAAQCKEILSRFLPLTEATISRILGTMARTFVGLEDSQNTFSTFSLALGCSISTELPILRSWNVEILVETVMQLAPGTNWIPVIENLDYDEFYIPNMEAFSFFMLVFRNACKDLFPLDAICGSVWKNVEGQLSFLKHAVSAQPEVFSFVHSERKLTYVDNVHSHEQQLVLANHAWLSLDLLNVLCQLAERGHTALIRSLLEYPLTYCPRTLLLGISRIKTAYNLVQRDVASAILPMIVKNTLDSGFIRSLWRLNAALVLGEILNAQNLELDGMMRLVEICHELKILSFVLESVPFSHGIRLAVLASRRGLLDIEKWSSSCLYIYKDVFVEECLRFIKDIHFSESEDFSVKHFHPSGAISDLYLGAASSFLKILKAHTSVISSPQLSEEVEKIHVQAEADAYFHQMFSGQLSVDAMVQMLARYKDSPVEREKAIFDRMIQNMVEEYPFFPKYSERQLKIAAILFGSVIKHQLISCITLGIHLRSVLDALRKPADSKMFLFGTIALEQFVNRLVELPQFCNYILQISHLRSAHPALVAVVEQALARISSGHSESDASVNPPISSQSFPGNCELSGSGIGQSVLQLSSSIQLQQRNEVSVDDPNKVPAVPSSDVKPLLPSSATTSGDSSAIQKNPVTGLAASSAAGFVRSSRGATSTSFGSALNIETLVAAAERREKPIEAAPSEVQDKISFIINNISTANLESKAKEFTEILPQQYYPWFAQYMVTKRASTEPNFHDLYLKLLDKVNSKALYKEIVQATYENCKVLLGSELIKSSSAERSLLKNLGSWLGKLTVGRSHVLLAREIDPKSLIVEAYEKGLMIAVIPFTSKVLEPCQNSLAYHPPNPWTMGILGLLAEIYSMPNLKMNLKFDIKALFNNLGVDMKDVAPTSLLKDRKRETDGNPDFSNKDHGVAQVSQPQIISEYKSGTLSPLSQALMEDEKVGALSLSDQLPSAQGLFQSAPSPSTFSISQVSAAIPNIGNHVIINQNLSAYGLNFPFQSVIPLAMDRAIKEVVSGIVQRSVCIACQTTKVLVLKDYALEPDETRIYNAAHLMVASLAGSLAHVTCKEPLRISISNHLGNSLQGLNITSEVMKQIVQVVTNDNLDLCCAAIEQAAAEKAIQTIDADIPQQLLLRRKHNPESLRPKPGHLSLSLQRVYEDFVQLPWQMQSSQKSHGLSADSSSAGGVGLSGGYGSVLGNQASGSSCSDGNVDMDIVSRSSDIAVESFESSSVAPPSVPSTQVGPASDAALLSTSGLHPNESSDAVMKMGALWQTLTSTAAMERLGSSITQPSLSTRNALDKYQIVTQKLGDLVASNAGDAEIQAIVSEVPEIIVRCVSRDEAALAVAQKAFKALYENASSSLHVSANLGILAAICDVCKRVAKELTSWVISSDEEHKFNKDVTIGLIRSDLLNLAEYNVHMAKHLDGGQNKSATTFAISLLQFLVTEESSVLSELHSLVDALAKLAAKPGSPESLQQLIDLIRNPVASGASLSGAATGSENNARQSKDEKAACYATTTRDENTVMEPVEPDPAAFPGQVSLLFGNWCKICELPGANDAACTRYVIQLYQNGLLKGDDLTESFFHILTELSVAHCISSGVINSAALQSPQQSQSPSFLAIDIYAKLVFSIMKYFPEQDFSSKLCLLSKILSVTVRFINKDAEEKKTSFSPRPYFRLFINWLLDLCSLDPAVDGSSFQILAAFAITLHDLQPFKVPAFSYAWLELISHRSFMPKLLTVNRQEGWSFVQRLLVDLLQFLEPFLRNAELGGPVHVLYKGTLRVLLVLLHDFPEFLCDYHFTFCDVIPPSCIQMRNIILSSFPRNMRLPDPSTPNLKIDLLPEIVDPPRILSEVDAALEAKRMKNDVDEYVSMRQLNSPFLDELKLRVLLSTSGASSAGTRYNVPLINSLVLYVGMQAIQELQAGASWAQSNANAAALEIFKYLSTELDDEGRYLFLNAVANQLRYPNNHTHYFSNVMLCLFHESDQGIIQEQITRVLVERVIVNRPHPWGLLVTLIELIRNPRYNFWKQGFIRSAPEIEKLLESVARSCGL